MAEPDGPRWAIIVHGGAHTIEPAEEKPSRRGCEHAVRAGQAVLEAGGTATAAVEAAIRVLEDDETFNAGYGSVVNHHGDVECDAAIMDGATLDVGAVAAVQGVAHPVSLAAALLREQTVLLAGTGAVRFARERRMELVHPADLVAPGKRHTHVGSDTVGCVALDTAGHFAAGTSTGGMAGKLPGRVGDSPLPGCGLYAEDGVGAVAVSGAGEEITRVALASLVMAALGRGSADDAAEAGLERLGKVHGRGGIIALDAQGRFGWAHSTPDFAVAYADDATPAQAFTRRAHDPASSARRHAGRDAEGHPYPEHLPRD
jgi:beta-aspartyl-peptidase (threonine type)